MAKKKQPKCSKCHGPLDDFSSVLMCRLFGEIHHFCGFCSAIINVAYTNVVADFMSDRLELREITRKMLKARIDRNVYGKTWK